MPRSLSRAIVSAEQSDAAAAAASSNDGRALKLAMADYTFPKLEWEQALRLARDLGACAIDIGIFAARSHLRPEDVLTKPAAAASRISGALRGLDLEIADLFGQPGAGFEPNAVNHPDSAERKRAAEFFRRLLELAARTNAAHVTLLPGVHFPGESYEDSLQRASGELAWRVEEAAKLGISLGVEPHIGSLISEPQQALHLVETTPRLTLTLDYGHFVCQGFSDRDVEPLIRHASHFHARGASKGKLQAPFSENTIDFARVLSELARARYKGYITLEYVWSEWMRCNEVDTLTETVLLRDQLRLVSSARQQGA